MSGSNAINTDTGYFNQRSALFKALLRFSNPKKGARIVQFFQKVINKKKLRIIVLVFSTKINNNGQTI